LRWIQGEPRENREVRVEELDANAVEEWTDGSRMEGSRSDEGIYLGTMAIIADAGELEVSMAWEYCDTVALDSQGVIGTADTGPDVPTSPLVDRGETGNTDGGEAGKADVGAGTSRQGGQRRGGSDGETRGVDGRVDA